MPSPLHEALVDMVRARADLVFPLLALARVNVPAGARAVSSAEGFSGTVADYRADAVAAVVVGEEVREVVVTEVQLKRDDEKLWSLPVYQALARARHRAPCTVLVVTPFEGVARWLRNPLPLGGGSIFVARVIGPAELDFRGDAATPEIAFLRALAHGRRRVELVVDAPAALAGLPEATQTLYCDLLLGMLPQAVRRAVEATMQTKYEYKSDFVKNWMVKPLEEARAVAREAALTEGRAEGRAEGLRSALLVVLASRGLDVGADDRARISSCTDASTLERWLARAASAATVADVLGEL